MKLIIVESPTKANTISNFLGKDFIVESSYGHVRDLPRGKLAIDIENNFAPQYVIPRKAQKTGNHLRKSLEAADALIIQTAEAP